MSVLQIDYFTVIAWLNTHIWSGLSSEQFQLL